MTSSRSLDGRLFPWLLILSLGAHAALPFLPTTGAIDRPEFEVEERVAAEPMTVRLIQADPEPVPQVQVDVPTPLMTAASGTRAVQSFDVEPVQFEREPRRVEPVELPPPTPMEEPLPEPEPTPLIEPIETAAPPEETPPPEPVKPPERAAPPPKDTNVKSGPIEQESQSGVVSRATPNGRGNRAPIYPRRARATKMEGTTTLDVWVRPDGSVERLAIFKSSGHSILDDEAMKAVKRWKFAPAKGPSGSPTEDKVKVPVTFRLKKK